MLIEGHFVLCMLCVLGICSRLRLVFPTYDNLNVLHVSVEIPHFLCSCKLLFVLGLVRWCIVLVHLKDILTFVCLNRLVIL